jgi:MYXO-CTERM domain-containing protein
VIVAVALLCAGAGWSSPVALAPNSEQGTEQVTEQDTEQDTVSKVPDDSGADPVAAQRTGGYSGAPDCGCNVAGSASAWGLAVAGLGLLRRRR